MQDKKFISYEGESRNSKVKQLLPLIIIVSTTLTIGAILFTFKITPEQTITDFNAMSETSLKNDLRVIKTPTPEDNIFIYAINQVAARGLQIAQNDTTVKQIIAGQKGDRALTIAAIQPTVLQDNNGKVSYSPIGQIIITSNSQYIDGKFHNPANLNVLENKMGESHKHIWNVFVDLDRHTVIGITEERA